MRRIEKGIVVYSLNTLTESIIISVPVIMAKIAYLRHFCETGQIERNGKHRSFLGGADESDF